MPLLYIIGNNNTGSTDKTHMKQFNGLILLTLTIDLTIAKNNLNINNETRETDL